MEAVIGVEEFFTPRVVGAGRRRRERDVEREREGEPPEYYELLNLNGSGPINVAVGPV